MNFDLSSYMYSDIFNFLCVTLMSLVIGLSQRKLYLRRDETTTSFGADRTFTLIGIFGYILYVIGDGSLTPFLCGGIILSLLFVVFFVHKIFVQGYHGITSIMVGLITYSLAPVVLSKGLWLGILIVVAVLLLSEMKEKFTEFAKSMNDDEFTNLAKFLIIAGVILPVLPKNELIEGTGLTPYTIWLATVVISGISYVSYLIKKYVFKNGGVIITGILGGIYSSTATCIILAKKAKEKPNSLHEYVAAIFCAVSMMYFKILILLAIFNARLAMQYWWLFAIMMVACALTALFFYKRGKHKMATETEIVAEEDEKNPLELKVSVLFAVLFVAFTLITHYALQYFGDGGLRVLSIMVGVTDINPFIINLFQTKYDISDSLLILAAFQAIISNNVVKMFYGMFFSERAIWKELLIGFLFICVINIALLFIAI